jgi:hypothetical protein
VAHIGGALPGRSLIRLRLSLLQKYCSDKLWWYKKAELLSSFSLHTFNIRFLICCPHRPPNMIPIGTQLLYDFLASRLQREDIFNNFHRSRDCAMFDGMNFAEILREILGVDEESLEDTACTHRADVASELLYELMWFFDLYEAVKSDGMLVRGISAKNACDLLCAPSNESVAAEAEKRTGTKLRFPLLPLVQLYSPEQIYEDCVIPLEFIKVRNGLVSSNCFGQMRTYVTRE